MSAYSEVIKNCLFTAVRSNRAIVVILACNSLNRHFTSEMPIELRVMHSGVIDHLKVLCSNSSGVSDRRCHPPLTKGRPDGTSTPDSMARQFADTEIPLPAVVGKRTSRIQKNLALGRLKKPWRNYEV